LTQIIAGSTTNRMFLTAFSGARSAPNGPNRPTASSGCAYRSPIAEDLAVDVEELRALCRPGVACPDLLKGEAPHLAS
jgi:hypothetical protein